MTGAELGCDIVGANMVIGRGLLAKRNLGKLRMIRVGGGPRNYADVCQLPELPTGFPRFRLAAACDGQLQQATPMLLQVQLQSVRAMPQMLRHQAQPAAWQQGRR